MRLHPSPDYTPPSPTRGAEKSFNSWIFAPLQGGWGVPSTPSGGLGGSLYLFRGVGGFPLPLQGGWGVPSTLGDFGAYTEWVRSG